MSVTPRLLPLFAAVAFAVLATGCSGDDSGGPRQPPAATVTTAEVVPVPWTDSIQALGTAQAQESVMITAKVTETVSRVNFEDGDVVEAGTVLVELSGRAELAELEEARASYRETRQQLERAEQLAARQLVAASDLDTRRAASQSARARMESIQARLGDRVISAPFDGVLGFREVSAGTLVTPGTTIASLDDISRIRLEFSVPETFISALSSGQVVEARSAAFPDRSFEGILRTIGSRVDPVTRSVSVRAEVPNPDRELRPGMLMTVRILRPVREALVIPEISMVQIGSQAFVYRVGDDDTVTQLPVRAGSRRAGEVEIVEGLNPGDRVVVQGVVKMRDGARIAEVRPDEDSAAAAAAADAENDAS